MLWLIDIEGTVHLVFGRASIHVAPAPAGDRGSVRATLNGTDLVLFAGAIDDCKRLHHGIILALGRNPAGVLAVAKTANGPVLTLNGEVLA